MLLLDRVELFHPTRHSLRCLVDGFVKGIVHDADDVLPDLLADPALGHCQQTEQLDEQTNACADREDDRNDFSDSAVGIRVDDEHELYLLSANEASESVRSFGVSRCPLPI